MNALRKNCDDMVDLRDRMTFPPEADAYYGDVDPNEIAKAQKKLNDEYDFESDRWEHLDGPVFA